MLKKRYKIITVKQTIDGVHESFTPDIFIVIEVELLFNFIEWTRTKLIVTQDLSFAQRHIKEKIQQNNKVVKTTEKFYP